jgi:hypothetical protein
VDADERLAVPHEVDNRPLLRVGQRQVPVGHQHQAVVLREVLRREERQIELC